MVKDETILCLSMCHLGEISNIISRLRLRFEYRGGGNHICADSMSGVKRISIIGYRVSSFDQILTFQCLASKVVVQNAIITGVTMDDKYKINKSPPMWQMIIDTRSRKFHQAHRTDTISEKADHTADLTTRNCFKHALLSTASYHPPPRGSVPRSALQKSPPSALWPPNRSWHPHSRPKLPHQLRTPPRPHQRHDPRNDHQRCPNPPKVPRHQQIRQRHNSLLPF